METTLPPKSLRKDSVDAPPTRCRESPLSTEQLRAMDAYWRAANYLSVGQIYLYDDPLLKSRSGASTSSRGCWAIGGPLRGSTSSTSTSTGSSRITT
jgi:hypothetical protein